MLPTRLRISACLIAATATVAACGGASATAPTATTPPLTPVPAASRLASDYANELVTTMQPHPINRRRINRPDLRAQLFPRAPRAPMVAGVGPVLGEGVAGFFLSPTGTSVSWSYRSGLAISGTSEIARTTTPYVLRARLPPRVAVLTDNLVASSGEVVVVSFRGRPNTRSFGAATCGLSTVNTGYRLSYGATLQLTTGP